VCSLWRLAAVRPVQRLHRLRPICDALVGFLVVEVAAELPAPHVEAGVPEHWYEADARVAVALLPGETLRPLIQLGHRLHRLIRVQACLAQMPAIGQHGADPRLVGPRIHLATVAGLRPGRWEVLLCRDPVAFAAPPAAITTLDDSNQRRLRTRLRRLTLWTLPTPTSPTIVSLIARSPYSRCAQSWMPALGSAVWAARARR